MSAQVHPAQQQRPLPLPFRKPLSETRAVHNQPKPAEPKQPKEAKEKLQQSPPLQRQNSKTVPPSPPRLIRNYERSLQFERVGFLGEGGFARVYEIKDVRGGRHACKVITASSLMTKKAKTKLWAEIKIQRSLNHPNIVKLQECFEDEENVYMTLELCHSGSLMDMLRRRKRFTEPETRYFLVQLAGACHYMHSHQVIHRDLKLGNLLLDASMNLKVGDFGLAALIENPGERKKTICGTPNYIAPEVLFDTANGHSFEVDTWSVGVILYTLVIGRPPFQTKEVKEIYKRIHDNDYEFPADRLVSTAVKDLIQLILTQDPQKRPTLHEIIDHTFFTQATFPGFIPISAFDSVPDFRHVSRLASQQNYSRLRREALLDDDQTSIAVPSSKSSSASSSESSTVTQTSIAQQEKEFQRAVQPGSPISALLKSARRPLMVNPAGSSNGESALYRKLQAAQVTRASPLRNRVVPGRAGGQTLQNIAEEEQQERAARQKELEAQKARIVAQMVPVREEDNVHAPAPAPVRTREQMRAEREARERKLPERDTRVPDRHTRVPEQENVPPVPTRQESRRVREIAPVRQAPSATRAAPAAPRQEPSLRLNSFDAAAKVLTVAFDAKATGKLFRDPRVDANLPEERVFISSWVDYCHKYGMAYALTDGSVGVYFNDSTSIVLSADKRHFDYITSRNHGAVFVRKSYTVDQYPDELKNKVYLLKHLEAYMMEKLWGEQDYHFHDVDRIKGMDWVQKYLRMQHVIVFKLSHDALQFNFLDHSKLILSSYGLAVTFIDKNYNLTRYTLSEIMARALKGPAPDAQPEEIKFFQRLVDKLHYCKEVLCGIHNAAKNGEEPPSTIGSDEQ